VRNDSSPRSMQKLCRRKHADKTRVHAGREKVSFRHRFPNLCTRIPKACSTCILREEWKKLNASRDIPIWSSCNCPAVHGVTMPLRHGYAASPASQYPRGRGSRSYSIPRLDDSQAIASGVLPAHLADK
jgi:hypothetical protein